MAPPYAYFTLAGLVVPTAFSLVLLVASLRGWHSSERYAQTVTDEKSSIAIVVQLFSHSLGLFQICALCVVISLSFQRYASLSPFSLNSLRFVNSAFALRVDWNLPLPFLIPLTLFIAFSLVPAAIWSGALTPNVISKNVTVPFTIPAIGTIDITENPLFGAKEGGDGGCPWITGDFGEEKVASFHNCFNKLSLLYSAATASSINAIPGREEQKAPVHAKLDRSGYSFIGRSYGTGGSVGFANISEVLSPLSLSFVETGLEAKVECTVNKTAEFRLEKQDVDIDLEVYNAIGNGTLPEGLSANIGKFGLESTHFGYLALDLFSWASAYNNHSTSYFALAAVPDDCTDGNWTLCAGYGFAQLHHTQCRLDFAAKSFDLEVDNVARTIAVTPKETIEWPPYADVLLEQLSAEHSYISYNDGAFGGSELGKAIRSNIDILRAYRNESTVNTDIMLQGVEDFIADLMDNSLLSFSQSRYFGERKERRSVDAELARHVVVYGEAKFIYAAGVLNLTILLVCFGEAARMRGWKRLSGLDLLDMASVAVGASFGGSKLAAHVQTLGARRDATGKVKVRLRGIVGIVGCSEV
ncbi:hypothetical protein K505DRAFT_1523 [Melanomma pulvis-pyrius CBS 109.77]|uniref:Uncharacterized protein n=1 Tax=Melanomma pulvis-pyrius CBS 109.77 TaxID=1314802 RepID=A0A6A6XXY6_9PLEO|nr:hypothetical protein K505DRAFT_1523 [Melanomma pulvis-pyrius CBS 109.77]